MEYILHLNGKHKPISCATKEEFDLLMDYVQPEEWSYAEVRE